MAYKYISLPVSNPIMPIAVAQCRMGKIIESHLLADRQVTSISTRNTRNKQR